MSYELLFTKEDLSALPLLPDLFYPSTQEIDISEPGVFLLLIVTIRSSQSWKFRSYPARVLKELAYDLTPMHDYSFI